MNNSVMPCWITQRAHLTPNRIAFVTEKETITFKELNERVEQKARQFLTLNVKKEDKIGLLSGNNIDMVEFYHANSLAKGISVPLNTRLTVEELIFQLKDCRASLLIYAQEYKEKAETIKGTLPDLKVLSIEEFSLIQEKDVKLREEFDLSDPHTIIYTSGTTGFPKGVVLTYGNHWWSAIGSVLNLGLSIDDKWLSCVPLFHVSGLSILMKNVIYGMTIHLYQSFDPKKVNRAIKEDEITMISVVTAMLQAMLRERKNEQLGSSLRCVLLGGGPAPKVLLEECRDLKIPVYQTYGLTESASQVVTLSPEFMLDKIGSAGKPLFPAQMKILTETFEEVSPYEDGEIFIKGPNVTEGYFNRPEANKKTFKDGWLGTGDIGYQDEDGFLFVMDRRKDLIISGGENIYPAEIEAALLRHPLIIEAGVTGIDHEKWGQVPVAFLKTMNNQMLLMEDVQTFLEGKLAAYKVPKEIHILEELPRNASNKLMRRKLRDYINDGVSED